MTAKAERLDDAALAAVAGGTFPGQRVGTAGDDSMAGGTGTDIVFGLEGNDTLLGNDGNDRLHGGAGHDSLSGGNGTDLLSGDAGEDTVDGGAGSDIITWRQGDGNDLLMGGANDQIGDILRMELNGVTASDLLQGFQPDPGSAQPRLLPGGMGLDLTGVSGSLTIGQETIRFTGFERLTVIPVGGR
jgi:Ca2+-binding RTX toxin-like protein